MMTIPSGIFSTYREAMALMLDLSVFGKECTLLYEQMNTSSAAQADKRKRLSIQPPISEDAQRGTESTEMVETRVTVTLRVYPNKKDFDKVGKMEYSAGMLMTICGNELQLKLKQAHFIVVDNEKYKKLSEPLRWGLDGNYLVTYWNKV
jgi:hypothetical protein